MQKLFFLSFLLLFSIRIQAISFQNSEMKMQTPPDSLLGTWEIDSIKIENYVITHKQAGNLGSMRFLSNNLLIIRTKGTEDQFHTYLFEPKKLSLIEEKGSLEIVKFSRFSLTLHTKNEGKDVYTIYKKKAK